MQNKNNLSGKSEQSLNVIDLLLYLASKWKWFLLSVLVCGTLAWIKYARAPLVFFRSATVIIKDPSNKTSTAGLDRYDNYINKVNVANEILQFKSKRLMREVIQRTHADISYRIHEGLRTRELYTSAPIRVSYLDSLPKLHMTFTVTPKDGKTVVLSDFSGKDEGKELTVKLNQPIVTAQGRLVVTPTNFYNKSWYGTDILIQKVPLESMVAYYQANFGIRQESEESSILKLSIKDDSPTRAEDVLNMLVTVYNEEAIKDKNQVAVNTANFINERLVIIGQELGDVESNLESFKRANQVLDISQSASMYMGESQKYSTDALQLETQLRLAQYIKDYLIDPAKEVELIPANTGLTDINIETQINQYNALKLRRDKLSGESSESNPVIEELNNSLRALKQNIIRAVDNLIVSINVKRRDAQARETQAQIRVASIPKKERQMISIERQQKIKESLYLFLLNRREENALSQAMADNNARVIDSAEGSNAPISPQRNMILLLGLLIGVAIPGTVFLLILFLDTRVHSRKDIEQALSIPYLGEIPIDREYLKQRKKGDHSEHISVNEQGEGIISEAFRIVRTNMAFMARKGQPQQVITFTSFREGAGKTFITRNLAQSLIFAKKSVVLVDLDIRKGTLSRSIEGHRMTGVTNFLADSSMQVDDIIRHHEGFDLIPAGILAPNPAELLMDDRLDLLFAA